MAAYSKSMPRFKKRWWGTDTPPIQSAEYVHGYKPGMNRNEALEYLESHSWLSKIQTPQVNLDWGPKLHTPPLYYPDGETVRIMDEFEELHKAKK